MFTCCTRRWRWMRNRADAAHAGGFRRRRSRGVLVRCDDGAATGTGARKSATRYPYRVPPLDAAEPARCVLAVMYYLIFQRGLRGDRGETADTRRL